MQHIERQKLILIIATGFFLALAAIVIVVSVVFSSTEKAPDPNSTYVPKAPTAEPDAPTAGSDGAVITAEPGEEDLAPPADMYANDYSKDEGYTKLDPNFDANVFPTEQTVYNDEYVYFTYSRLMCELSNKKTATPEAVKALQDFSSDLTFNGSSMAITAKEDIDEWITWYENHEGERVSVDQQEELHELYCNAGNLDLHDH